MKTLLATLLLCLSGAVSAYQCNALKDVYGMSDLQVYNLHRSFQYGYEHDMGYSLAAISFLESSGGKNLKNPDDPSGGHHHILVWHIADDFGMERTQENAEFIMKILADNFYLSAHYAVKVLGWWLDRHDGDWFKAWRSYNQGHYWRLESESARERSWVYASRVNELVQFMIQYCPWEDNLTG